VNSKEESAEDIRRREHREMVVRCFRPILWQKLALGLKIPKGWDKLFDIEKEEAEINEVRRKGLI